MAARLSNTVLAPLQSCLTQRRWRQSPLLRARRFLARTQSGGGHACHADALRFPRRILGRDCGMRSLSLKRRLALHQGNRFGRNRFNAAGRSGVRSVRLRGVRRHRNASTCAGCDHRHRDQSSHRPTFVL